MKSIRAKISVTPLRSSILCLKGCRVQIIDNSISAIVEERRLRQINNTTFHSMLIYDFIDTMIQFANIYAILKP